MCAMNRKEFILSGAGAFFIASAGKAFGADAPSNPVRLALVEMQTALQERPNPYLRDVIKGFSARHGLLSK